MKFREFLERASVTSSLSEASNFADSNAYYIRAKGNFWGGSRYEMGIDEFVVLAKTESEATKIAERYIDVVDQMFREKRLPDKKLAIQKGEKNKVQVWGNPKIIPYKMNHPKILTKKGKFESINLK